jgi:hypothetical protein
MVNSEELIDATEYLTLYTKCRINRCRYNRGRPSSEMVFCTKVKANYLFNTTATSMNTKKVTKRESYRLLLTMQ